MTNRPCGSDPVVIRFQKSAIGVGIRSTSGRFGTERPLVRIQSPRPSFPPFFLTKQPDPAGHWRFLSGNTRSAAARGLESPNSLNKNRRLLPVAVGNFRVLIFCGSDPVVIRDGGAM